MRRGSLWTVCFCLTWAVACLDRGPRNSGPGIDPPKGKEPVRLDAGFNPNPQAGGTATTGTGGPKAGLDAGSTMVPGNNRGGAGRGGSPMMSGAADGSSPASGTGGAADAEDGGANSGGAATQDPWFVGFWVVDQPAHALYEATLYELKAGGTLVVHDTMVTGAAPYTGYVTGTVSDMQGGVRCALDTWWASEGNHRVAFGSACTDSTQRTIMLSFQEDDPTQATMPTIESVGNESGWTHRDQLWMWRKCPTRDNCPPF